MRWPHSYLHPSQMMHPPPPALPPRAQTTKQAKASFKARGSTSISHTEWKWLHREVELEERAEKLQEQERRRAEAARKKAAKEKADKAERERAMIGTQRRLDRFGYKSSQMHLGKFFGRPSVVGLGKGEGESEGVPGEKTKGEVEPEPMQEDEKSSSEEFEDGDIDDEALLGVLEQPVMSRTAEHEGEAAVPVQHAMLPPVMPVASSDKGIIPQKAPIEPSHITIEEHHAPTANEDIDAWWDDLESSTQIARELNSNTTSINKPVSPDRKDSFGSASFDLTLEDLDRLDPFKTNESLQPQKSVIELPSAVTAPAITSPTTNSEQQPAALPTHSMPPPAKSMPPPHLPAPKTQSSASRRGGYQPQPSPFTSARQMHMRSVAPAAARFAVHTSLAQNNNNNLGFTSTQLETLIDDDLQLTQDAPG